MKNYEEPKNITSKKGVFEAQLYDFFISWKGHVLLKYSILNNVSLQALQRMFQNLNPQRKDHSFLNNHCTLRGHSIIMFALRGGRWWGPSKFECMKIGREEVASMQMFTHIFS